ncbi:hypothetical protein E2C01_048198 [Portunus trituberculatus]|uniref:CCHC-type domain-containing protein n=1 Tax=Portunus trituberculatus TaxID=210409 RepID=A0A5B7GAW8_PORTR|nr:hypothetical protein [Portunus trituberculatus]
MEPSGPVSLADLEADLAMSDEDEVPHEHWPSLPSLGRHDTLVAEVGMSLPTTQASSAIKCRINYASDSSTEPSSPAAKSTRRKESSGPEQRVPVQPTAPLAEASPLSAPSSPAFASRTDYVKLLFKDNPSVDIKLRWLSEIQDSPEQPRKFPTYLITRYPVCTDAALAKELPGIYTARRFYQNGTPINRLVVTWSLPQPPPPSIAFSFLPCLPPCEFRRMPDEQLWCYRCWNSGHISRYCSALEWCAYCSESHDSRTCLYRPPPPPVSASDSAQVHPQPSPPDTSHWKCPRCHQPGVSAWHPGCARRRANAAPSATRRPTGATQPPPPPPNSASPPASTTASEPMQVTALREAVATLKTRISTLSARFDDIEAHLNGLISKQATLEATINALVESHQVVIASIDNLTRKLDTVASSLETLTAPAMQSPPRAVPSTGTHSTTASSSRRHPPKGNVQ